MSEKTPVVRGFRDVYPGDSERFDLVERSMIEVIGKYGYQEIRLPIVESVDLFSRCLLYTSPSPRDYAASRMPSSA